MPITALKAGRTPRASELELITDALNALSLTNSATVVTSEGTATTSFTDLATVGPALTVVTGTSALVIMTASMGSSGGGLQFMTFAVSGATTLAASEDRSLRIASTTAIMHSVVIPLTTLTPGSNIFTAKYRASAGTADFYQRSLIVIPFGV